MEQIEHPPELISEQAILERTNDMYEKMLAEPAIVEALTILDGLPEGLYYHNKNHTLDVLHETILFAVADNADENVIRQQSIAAAFHDTGFVKKREHNEPDG